MGKYPDFLKIGGHHVRLVFANHWANDEGNYGEWIKEENTIFIKIGLSDTFTFSTIVHEALHVMNASLDHALLDSLSEQMSQFLLDNDISQ